MANPTVNDVHINSAMTQISIAYKNAQYIADQVFPVVRVAKKSDYYFVFNGSDWYRDEIEVRAPGTRARLVDYTLSSASYSAITYSVGKMVTDEERANADEPLQPDTAATEYITNALLLGMERRVATVVTTCANWASASNPGTAWSDPTSDVFGDIELLRGTITGKIGREPNVAVMGYNVYKALKTHPDVMDRIKYVDRGILTEEVLRSLLQIDKVLIGRSIYNSAKEGATDSISYIWGAHLWMGWVPATAGLMLPAAGYVFEWGAREVRQKRDDLADADIFEIRHSTAEKISASDAGGGLFTVVS